MVRERQLDRERESRTDKCVSLLSEVVYPRGEQVGVERHPGATRWGRMLGVRLCGGVEGRVWRVVWEREHERRDSRGGACWMRWGCSRVCGGAILSVDVSMERDSSRGVWR